jgi:predicted nucleotidyltransferase
MNRVTDREDILNYLHSNRNYLLSKYSLRSIALIGSFSRNEQNQNSDIDFIVEFNDLTPNIYELKINLRNELQTQLGRRIEVASKKYLKPYYREQILNEAIYA